MQVEFKRVAGAVRQAPLAFHARPGRTGADVADAPSRSGPGIRTHDTMPPVAIPPGHVGPVVLPGTGRLVYWTGRVAIGLRHQPGRRDEPVAQSALWVQDVMLGPGQALA